MPYFIDWMECAICGSLVSNLALPVGCHGHGSGEQGEFKEKHHS